MVPRKHIPGRLLVAIKRTPWLCRIGAMGRNGFTGVSRWWCAGASATIDITLRDDTAELEGTLLGISPTSHDPGRWSPQSFIYCIPLPDSPGQFLELSARVPMGNV